MKRIILNSIVSLLFITSAFANPLTDSIESTTTFGYERFAGQSLTVHALNGLKLRHEPSFKAQTLTILDYGEVITLLGETPESKPFNVGYATGKWIHVDVNGLNGYIFDGFVSSLPIPEVLAHTEYLTSTLEQYAHANFKWISTDTITRSSEMDERFNVKYRFYFNDNVHMQYNAFWQSESIKLELPNARIMDAYHVVKALLTVSDLKATYGNDLIFKINDAGEIYEISDRFKEDIIIKKVGDKNVSIEFKTYVGC